MTSPQTDSALLPCPFCGNQPKTKEWTHRNLPAMRVWCDECSVSPTMQSTKINSVESWNTRASLIGAAAPAASPVSVGDEGNREAPGVAAPMSAEELSAKLVKLLHTEWSWKSLWIEEIKQRDSQLLAASRALVARNKILREGLQNIANETNAGYDVSSMFSGGEICNMCYEALNAEKALFKYDGKEAALGAHDDNA